MEIQDEFHIKMQSENENDRIGALSQLMHYTVDDLQFIYLPHFNMEEIGKDLHKVSTDNVTNVKKYATRAIEVYFRYIQNKDQLWMDLIRLASDDDSNVRDCATTAINSVYPLVENKDRVWAGLIDLVRSNYTNTRDTATKILISVFPKVSTKNEAMEDLSKLALENDCELKQIAAKIIGSIFPYIPEKTEAWKYLRKLLVDKDVNVKRSAVSVLYFVFPSAPNKIETWNELHRLVYDDDSEVRQITAKVIGSVFPHIPEKKKAWEDLHHLILEDDVNVKRSAAGSLGAVFPYASEKEQIWTDVIKLISNSDTVVQKNAKSSFNSTLNYVVEKERLFHSSQQKLFGEDGEENGCNGNSLITILLDVLNKENAWNNLTTIAHDRSSDSLKATVKIITYIFPVIPDKDRFWVYLYNLVLNEKELEYLLLAFAYVPNKEKALEDLIRLNSHMEIEQKWGLRTISRVGEFVHEFDKEKVYKSLQNLISSQDIYIEKMAISTLVLLFPFLPDKDQINLKNWEKCDREQAWDYLLVLTSDDVDLLKRHAASALGFVFRYVPDKNKAWKDIHKLAYDRRLNVRWGVASSIGYAFPYIPDKEQAWKDLLKLTSDDQNYVRTNAYHSMGRISIFKASQSKSDEEYKRELEKAIYFFEKASKELTYFPPSKFCLPFYRSFYTIVFEKEEKEKEVEKYLLEAKAEIEESKNKKILLEAIENLSNALKEVQNIEDVDLEVRINKLNSCRKYCEQAAELMNETEITAPFAVATVKKGLPFLGLKLKSLLEEIQEKAKTVCRESRDTDTEEIACAVSQEVQKWEIGSQEEMTQNIEGLIETFRMRMPHLPGYEHIFEEIEGIRNENDLVKQYKIVSRLVGLIPIFSSMPDHVVQDIKEIKEKTTSISNEVKYLQLSVDRLIESVDELQNPQEYLDTIQRNLEEIKNDIPGMKGKIDDVLYELYSPMSTTQKLKVAIPIIPLLVSYEIETDVPRLVADKIYELKNLVSRQQ